MFKFGDLCEGVRKAVSHGEREGGIGQAKVVAKIRSVVRTLPIVSRPASGPSKILKNRPKLSKGMADSRWSSPTETAW